MSEINDADFKNKLDHARYKILRQKGTEAPFSGKLLNNHQTGSYHCAACKATVFSSHTKFESGSGWPSFYEPENRSAVILSDDESDGMRRVEVICANCGSHLGHLFNDAYNQPTGQRYCINSLALEFNEAPKKDV